MSILETDDVLGFSCLTISTVYREWSKVRKYPVRKKNCKCLLFVFLSFVVVVVFVSKAKLLLNSLNFLLKLIV